MVEKIRQTLRDSKIARWTALAVVAFTMLCGYFLTDVMAPLKPMLEEQLLWSSTDYGIFTSAYGWFNVFLLMLIFGTDGHMAEGTKEKAIPNTIMIIVANHQ